VAFENPSVTCYVGYVGEEKEMPFTVVGCKCLFQEGISSAVASLLRIFGGVTISG
jgi:hypothetical protein